MPTNTLPVIRPLPRDFSAVDAFARLCSREGCLWLDSASSGPTGEELGRYSFLTADPVRRLVASIDDGSPWPTLERWCRDLPTDHDPALPPFQGGIAGLLGYEAASWLEPVGVARENDLPTPPVCLGLYDWTIAIDHHHDKAWLISQGLGAQDSESRFDVAVERADFVEGILLQPVTTRATNPSIVPIADRHLESSIASNFSSAEYRAAVAEIVRRIRDGDSFQVNLAQRLLQTANLPSDQLYLRLRDTNPAPFGSYYDGGDFQVLSSSPERFLRVRDRLVESRPIKGTTARIGYPVEDQHLAQQLSRSDKDRAENVMIVDLMRNDLSRVCRDDSVQVRRLCEIERYQYVQHLVSVVEGRLNDDATISDLLAACFPGGSITGAPKIEAMRTIAELEPNRRGPYCGSLGYISCGGNADFNILIRTITAAHGKWQIPVGGGITAQSNPADEEAETWTKAEGMLRAIGSETAKRPDSEYSFPLPGRPSSRREDST